MKSLIALAAMASVVTASAACFGADGAEGIQKAAKPPAGIADLFGGFSSITTSRIEGSGNTVIVDGTGPGRVHVSTTTKGPGNRVIVTHNGRQLQPEKIELKDKNPGFTRQRESKELSRTQYWSPKYGMWFQHHAKDGVYRPDMDQLRLEVRRVEAEAKRAIEQAQEQMDRMTREADAAMAEMDDMLSEMSQMFSR